MQSKYTKFCNSQTLIRIIQTSQKDEQAMHIMMSVFKKPLNYIQQKFGRQGIFDAIHKLTVKRGKISQPLAWLFVIKEGFSYHEMPFHMSEFIIFTEWSPNNLCFSQDGVFAVLTLKDNESLMELHYSRERQSIKRFIKLNMFYPFYLEDHNVQELLPLIRIKKLRYGKRLNWKDQDGSHKFGVIYNGLVTIEYRWKRNIEVAQLTRGMYLTNHYIKDQIQEIQDYELQQIDQPNHKPQRFPKFRYISKSDDTILLLLNVRLIKQSPYNINPHLLPLIKNNFDKYIQNLQKVIGFEEFNKLHRNKSSIKEEIKRNILKESVRRQISLQMSRKSIISSPIIKTYALLEYQANPFQKNKTIQLPETVKQFSKAIFTSIPARSPNKTHLTKQTDHERSLSSRRLIHNTWVEQMSKNTKKIKSFSTLQTLTTFNPQREVKRELFQEQMQTQKKTEFFIPEQFVKRKLKLKYEGLIDKMRNLDLTMGNNNEESITNKMQRLQNFVDSKRIVKLNNTKIKFKMLRDKVEY